MAGNKNSGRKPVEIKSEKMTMRLPGLISQKLKEEAKEKGIPPYKMLFFALAERYDIDAF